MISANNITLRVGKKALFEDVNIKFTEGNCYGLIGANGAGKSTFLKILSGQLEPTNGDVVITPGQRLSFLQQDHFKYDAYTVQTDQDLKNILGHVAYLLEGVKRLFDIKSYHMRIESEELTVEDDFIFGMITNSRSVGGFKNLTGKNVDMNDGLFEVTMITRPKNPLELQEIMTAMLTAEDNTDLIHSFKSARVTITSEEPVPWTLDGEYGGSHTQIEIENCHEALNLYLKSTKNEETRSIGISPLINKKEK